MKRKNKKIVSEKQKLSSFINNVVNRDYDKASKDLSFVVDKKIQRKIINNNINIF